VQRIPGGGIAKLPIYLPPGTCRSGLASFTCGLNFTFRPWSSKGWQTFQQILKPEILSFDNTYFQVRNYFPLPTLGKTRHGGSILLLSEEPADTQEAQLASTMTVLHMVGKSI